MKILLVDDDTVFSENIIKFLSEMGHIVYYCSDPVSLDRESNIKQVDLALLDLMLPPTYMTEGLEILAILKKIKPDIIVAMFSCKSDRMTSIVAKAYSEGIHSFLDKNDSDFMISLKKLIWEVEKKVSGKVFISYGHNELLKLKLKEFIRERLKREIVILDELPNSGLTVVEKLEKASTYCNCAIILLTRDDEVVDGGRRARQNVIHEIGFFQGKYGRNRVILICEKGVDIFSNISGIMRIEFEADHFEAVYDSIRRELEFIN